MRRMGTRGAASGDQGYALLVPTGSHVAHGNQLRCGTWEPVGMWHMGPIGMWHMGTIRPVGHA